MRPIDADALMEDIRKHSESYFAEDFAHEWVDKQPTIEPERKTGHWVGARQYCQRLEEITGGKYSLSGIGNMIYCDQCWNASDRKSNYCPRCGSYKGGGA